MSRPLATQAARYFVERHGEEERADLLRRILEENKALRADNDVLAIGIGQMQSRMAEAEAQIAMLLDRTRVYASAKNTDPYPVPDLPKPHPPRKVIAAVNDMRARWTS